MEPKEKITLKDAIRHHTIGSAKDLMFENDIGSIEAGKYGDFALFSTKTFSSPSLQRLKLNKIFSAKKKIILLVSLNSFE